MENGPKKTLMLYRGYVVYFYRGDEKVTSVAPPGGGPTWQSREKLEEELIKQVALGRKRHPADTTMPKDVAGYIEEFSVQLSE